MNRFTNLTISVVLAMAAVVSAFCAPAFADQITIDLPAVDVTVTKDADSYAKFSFTDDRIQFIGKTGDPAIPYLVVKSLLPPGTDLSTVRVEIKREDFSSNAIGERWEVRPTPVPATWDGTKVITIDDTGGDDPYGKNALFPYTLLSSISTGAIWEWLMADIPVALFQYNPVSKELYRIKANEAVITFEHKSSGARAKRISSGSQNLERVRKSVVNFDALASEYGTAAKRRAVNENSGYVMITTKTIVSDSNQLDNFVRHKENRGFNVHVITEDVWGGGTGSTAADNIRNWLKNNYTQLNIEYVLLIGNPNPSTGNVPMKMLYPRGNAGDGYEDSPSDYFYADLTGNWDLDGDGRFGEWEDDFGTGGVDRNFEVVVGRIPYYGNMNDLDSILSKIMAYQNETNQEWRKNILLPMEPSDPETPGYHLGEEIKNSVIVPKGWDYFRVYEENYGLSPEKVPCTVNNVTSAWTGSQFGAIFWWTHGWEKGAVDIMDLSNAAKLDNTHPGFTFQCSCTNSHPETSDNLSYSLLKNGAIATLGATRVSWYGVGQTSFAGSSTNSGMTYEYAKRLIENDMRSAGYALHDMKQTLSPGSHAELWMNFTDFCLYGDPEVSLMDADNAPILSVTPTSREVSRSSGTTTFSVENTGKGAMNWTAKSNASWLTLRNTTGTDNDTVTVDYDPADADRTGTITITAAGAENSPQTVEVKQTEVEWRLYDDFETGELSEDKWTTYNVRSQCDNSPCYEYYFENGRLKLITNSENSGTSPDPYIGDDIKEHPILSIGTGMHFKNAQLPLGVKVDFEVDSLTKNGAVHTNAQISIRFKGDSGADYSARIGLDYNPDIDGYVVVFHCYQYLIYDGSFQSKIIERETFFKKISLMLEITNEGPDNLITNASFTVDNQTHSFESVNFVNHSEINDTFETVMGNKQIGFSISNGMWLTKPDGLPTTPTEFVQALRDSFAGNEITLYVDNIYTKNFPILSVSYNTQILPSTSGTTTFTVKNIGTGLMNWTATENSDWFSVSPASETNGETLTITYDANPGNERTGEIIITAGNAEDSPKTIRVTQTAEDSHFSSSPGNTTMTLWINSATIDGLKLSPGDEIAVYDGTKCVGSRIVESGISETNPLKINVTGFTPGHPLSFRFWNSDTKTELTVETADLTDMTYYGTSVSSPIFMTNESYGVNLSIGISLSDVITGLKIMAGIENISIGNADADNNGKTEMKDVVYILQKLAGMR